VPTEEDVVDFLEERLELFLEEVLVVLPEVLVDLEEVLVVLVIVTCSTGEGVTLEEDFLELVLTGALFLVETEEVLMEDALGAPDFLELKLLGALFLVVTMTSEEEFFRDDGRIPAELLLEWRDLLLELPVLVKDTDPLKLETLTGWRSSSLGFSISD